jgi:hypothetical protein
MCSYYCAYTKSTFLFENSRMCVNSIIDPDNPLNICDIFPMVECFNIGIPFDQTTRVIQIDAYTYVPTAVEFSPLVNLLDTLYTNKTARKSVFNTYKTQKIVNIVGEDTFCNFELQLKNEYYKIIKLSNIHKLYMGELDVYLNYNNLLNDNGLMIKY